MLILGRVFLFFLFDAKEATPQRLKDDLGCKCCIFEAVSGFLAVTRYVKDDKAIHVRSTHRCEN